MIMNTALYAEPSFALQSLMAYLEKEYYAPIGQMCGRIVACTTEIHQPDVHPSAPLIYASQSKKLAEQVGRYIRLRRRSLLPYLNELAEKEDNGHDCRNCATSCTIRHSTQLADIQDAHRQIRETMDQLRSITPPAPDELRHQYGEAMLRKEIAVLDEQLSELLYLEETALIPKITEAQKSIHAHD